MKRFVPILTVLMSAALFTSCYMMSTRPTGSIKLNFGGPAGRSISPSATVRVYLYTYGSSGTYSLYTFPNGAQYDSFQYSSGSATLSNIPTGLWDVLVSIGTSSNGVFSVSNYGDSGVISVSGGENTPASITTTANPFTYASAPLAGKNITGVVYDNLFSDLFASTSSAFYEISAPLPAAPTPTVPNIASTPATAVGGLPGGVQINSLSWGYNQFSTSATASIFVNTNDGVIPYYYSSTSSAYVFDTTNFTYALSPTGTPPPYTILSSAAVIPGTTTAQTGLAVYYSRPGGFGGVYISPLVGQYTAPPTSTSNGAGAPWYDISVPSAGSGDPVYQMAPDLNWFGAGKANRGFTYFATTFGAFRASTSLVDSTNPNHGQLTSSNITYFSAPNNAAIHSVAVDDADGVIYIGTTDGAYWGTLDESSSTNVISGNWTPISATAGDDIVSIKLDTSLAGNYAGMLPSPVALRSSSNNIYALTAPPNQGGTETTYPFYSGLPGTVNEMSFLDGTLFLAGTEGLASVEVIPPIALG